MKRLNVRWVPETFAIASLTIATSQEVSATCGEIAPAKPRAAAITTPAKFIVISGETELKADVRTATP